MPIIRMKRQAKGLGPIGTVNLNTGGAEKYGRIANAANQMVEVAVKEMARASVSEAEDKAAALSSTEIKAINPLTGEPEALNELNANNFVGRTAGEAYQRLVTDRFQQEISTDIKLKANELALKYQDDPNNIALVSNALGEYTKSLAFGSEENGKPTLFTNFIESQSAMEMAQTEISLRNFNATREKTKLKESLENGLNDDLITAFNAGKTFSDTEEGSRFGNTSDDFDPWLEARVAKVVDAEETNLLGQGKSREHNILLRTAYATGKVNSVIEKLAGNDIQRKKFLLAIKTQGGFTDGLSEALKPTLENILKYTDDNNVEKIATFTKDLSNAFLSAETAEASQLAAIQSEENKKLAIQEKQDFNVFASGNANQGILDSSLLYNNLLEAVQAFDGDSAIPLQAALITATNLINNQERTLQDYIRNANVNLKEGQEGQLRSEYREKILETFLILGAEQGNPDEFLTGLARRGRDLDELPLTDFQKSLIGNLVSKRIFQDTDLSFAEGYYKSIESDYATNIEKFKTSRAFANEGGRLGIVARKNGIVDEVANDFINRVTINPLLDETEKKQLINGIQINKNLGILNNKDSFTSLELNGIHLYIESDGKDRSDAVLSLSEESVQIANDILQTMEQSPETFDVSKKEVLKSIRSREERVRQQEIEEEKLLKESIELQELNKKIITGGGTVKDPKARLHVDKVLLDNFGVQSSIDKSSLIPEFINLNRYTLSENLISNTKKYLSGTDPFTDEESEILFRHLMALRNDISEKGVVNRLRGAFSEKEAALLDQVLEIKQYHGDNRSASEIIIELQNAINGPNAQENADNIFGFTDFGKRVPPKSWVMRNLRVDASVAGQIDSVASMYAQMGLSREDIKTNLDNYINQNYAESVHVVDPNFSIHNDKAKTRFALSLIFPDEDERQEFITRVNNSLPRGFRLGEPQEISYTTTQTRPSRSGKRIVSDKTVVTGMTKQVFLVPFMDGDIPEFYAYYKEDTGEIRPLIIDQEKNPLEPSGETDPFWPMFDTSLTGDFMQNKYEQEKQFAIQQAEATRQKMIEKANKKFIPTDSFLRRLGIVTMYNIDLP